MKNMPTELPRRAESFDLSAPRPTRERQSSLRVIRKNYDMYLLMIPGLLFLLIFRYTPMYGLIISFQDFNIFKGVGGSDWVGLAHFRKLFGMPEFYRILRNTLLISLYKIVFAFPVPIIIALMLNEIRAMAFKRTVQTIVYLPHFLSWVVVTGLFVNILSPSGGIVNQALEWIGLKPVPFLLDKDLFRSVLVGTYAWKDSGWTAIIFLAAMAGIDQEQYEAAKLDGAGRLQQMWHITVPGIASTILLLLIIRLGHVLDAGTEQILLMYNPTVYETGDVLSTYIYRRGIGQSDYSFSSAVGMFNSVVGFLLIVCGNALSRKFLKRGIW